MMTRNVMLTEDYLIRQINIYLAAIGRILGFKTAYMFIEAQIAVDEALEEIFGIPANLIRQMDDQALLESATHLEVLNTDKIQAAAEVFKEEGDLRAMRGDHSGSIHSYTRALNFYLDAVLNGGAWHLPDPADKIEEMIRNLAGQPLDPDTWYGLFLYAEQQGQWSRAEQILEVMEAYPDLEAEVQRLREEFFTRLAGLSEEQIAVGGLTREHVLRMVQEHSGGPSHLS